MHQQNKNNNFSKQNVMAWLFVFCWIFAAYGACYIIIFGEGPFHIFERLREFMRGLGEGWGTLFSCMLCLPANFGLFGSLIDWFLLPVAFTPFNILFSGFPCMWWAAALLDATFTSGCVWIIHHVFLLIDNRSDFFGVKTGKVQIVEEENKDIISIDDTL